MTTPNPGQVSEPVSPIESEAPDFTPTSLEASQKATDNADTPSFIRGSSDSRIGLAGEPQVQQSTGTHPIDTRPTGPESTNTEPTVDTVTQLDETPAAARTDIHDKPPQYESYPEVYYAENAQDNQLPQVVYDRSFPQVSYDSHPEAYNQEGSTLEALRQRKERKTCGLPKKWFWAVLATVIGVVVVAAIVGGVVGSRSRNSKKGTSFMPTTALAAVNYTETTGVQHRRVYFQADDRSLYQSAWDSNSQKWDVSPLNPNNSPGPEIKPGTPLAAYVYNDQSHSTLEFHVFFLDTENRIWERGTPNADDMWGSQVSKVLAGNYTTSNDSDIAVYAAGCEDWCASTSVIVWQGAEGKLWSSGFITNYGWWAYQAGVDADHPLLSGSSLSLVPIWGNQSDGELLSVYANTGNLSRFVFNTTEKWENGWTYDGMHSYETMKNREGLLIMFA
ncbi:hypothetical protein GTA08_BOTSDO03720 [Neofusicoccum parvum]|nr:hypothetical protein GTA08_BOTSDO03720 [Neofusicoccum parvum]